MPRKPAAEPAADDGTDATLLERCRAASVQLLHANLTPRGILAATPGAAARERRYTRIFGRDAAICVLAMTGSGDPGLEAGAVASLDALAEQQAPNGQIPKYVDPLGRDADFWYLGCIDATLWWLIAVRHVGRRHPDLATRWQASAARAIDWLLAQEHQRFFLLQQNEASDWADIMPRSGFVLYTNALWLHTKRLYGLEHVEATHHHANHLFHPFGRDLPEYRRARLLRHYAARGRRQDPLYMSFVNLALAGDEGDVFGNLLAVLCGLAGDARGHAIVQALREAAVAEPYPVRVVTRPIVRGHPLFRDYMLRHQQNHPHQYHNGGIWPFVGGFWVLALVRLGLGALAREELAKLARVNALDRWRFTEWLHGRTLAPMGMPGQSWNAAAFLLAIDAVGRGDDPFGVPPAGAGGG
jgi:glycogen debranching enzyme